MLLAFFSHRIVMRLAAVLLVLCLAGTASARLAKPAECCKIMGSLDCTACKAGVPLAKAVLRDLPPDPKALHLPQANRLRFNDTPKVLRPRPQIISTEADDVTNGAPIACPQGSPNCYRPPQHSECGGANGEATYGARLGMPNAPCLRPGQNVGPIMKPGGKYAPMYPAPYGLPHYPFPPDTQDWTRPAMVTARNEGEVSESEGEKLDKEELEVSDHADAR